MVWNSIREWNQKTKLREMLNDPRSARGVRSIGQLEKGIGADRSATERQQSVDSWDRKGPQTRRGPGRHSVDPFFMVGPVEP
jgi:hypothetical protein